jgi:serine/threonine protein kinase
MESSAPSSHREEIAAKLASLHQGSYVHGDIRNANVMVKEDGSLGIRLVDFDWSGKVGEVRYPMSIYRGARLWRPGGAKRWTVDQGRARYWHAALVVCIRGAPNVVGSGDVLVIQ